jgi:hypothetical protein
MKPFGDALRRPVSAICSFRRPKVHDRGTSGERNDHKHYTGDQPRQSPPLGE